MSQNTVSTNSVSVLFPAVTRELTIEHRCGRNTVLVLVTTESGTSRLIVDHGLIVAKVAAFEEARRLGYLVSNRCLHGTMRKVGDRYIPFYDERSLTALQNVLGEERFAKFVDYTGKLCPPPTTAIAAEIAAEVKNAPAAPEQPKARKPRRSKSDAKPVAPAFPVVEAGHVVTVAAEFGY